jgi:hypothetical protein
MASLALDRGPSTIEIVTPVYNEQDALEASLRKLHAYVQLRFPFTTRITIADNASTDAPGRSPCAWRPS